MIRGLIGKIFMLGLGIFAVLSLAPGPQPTPPSRSEGEAARAAALREMIAPEAGRTDAPAPALAPAALRPQPSDGGNGEAAGIRAEPPRQGPEDAGPSPAVRPVTFSRAAPPPVLGTRDAPPEYLARMRQTQGTPGPQAGGAGERMVRVTARAVNLRAGPTTKSAILGRLTRGQTAELIRDHGNGWAEIRVPETGRRGFMASRFLAPVGE